MKAIISPGKLSGSIEAIPSKSEAHRLLICAALTKNPTKLELGLTSEDIEATLGCIKKMGCTIERSAESIIVYPGPLSADPVFDCCESGSTLRFLLPVAAALFDRSSFIGRGRLPQRPMEPLLKAMESKGVRFSQRTLPFTASGKLIAGEYEIAGNVSSQYITGLLLALPLLSGDSVINLTTALESKPYLDITAAAMDAFGVTPYFKDDAFYVSADEYRSPGTVKVGGDWSNAAFFLTATTLGSDVAVTGLDPASVQGDRTITKVLKEFSTNGCIVTDISQTPDMLPILSIAAAMGSGESVFSGGARLKTKESDRLLSCTRMINDLGGCAGCTDDTLIVKGTGLLGGTVDSFGDHRIAMAAAIAGTVCKKEVIIEGAQAVNKSYPGFFEDFKKLGGRADVI